MPAMKVAIAIALVGASAQVWAAPEKYGPSGCVTLDLSQAGACVIKTNCAGQDLSHFEFAFDCVTPQGQSQRHSFGLGGFDAQEEFDTDVTCKSCTPPDANKAAKVASHSFKLESSKVVAGAESHAASAAQADEVVKYGPDKCVSTYKSPEGHCMMQTACAKANITNYDFGLICVDAAGAPTRHLFGKNSFDSEETFDTLIPCDQCMSLEDIPDDIALTGQVVSLTKEVKGLKTLMQNLSSDIQMLNEKVFPEEYKKANASEGGGVTKTLIHYTAKRTPAEKRTTVRVAALHHGRKAHHTGARMGAKAAVRVHHHARHKERKRSKHLRSRHVRHHHQVAAAEADEEVAEEEEEAPPKHHHKKHHAVSEEADEEVAEEEEEAPPKHHHHHKHRRVERREESGEDGEDVVGAEDTQQTAAVVAEMTDDAPEQDSAAADGAEVD